MPFKAARAQAAAHGQGVAAKLGAEDAVVCPVLVATAVMRYCCPAVRLPTMQLVAMLTALSSWVVAVHVGAGATQLPVVVPSHEHTSRV